MAKVTLTINGKEIAVPAGTSILDATEKAGFKIPRLCHDKDLPPVGACRLCVVEVKGARALVASCATEAANGMEVQTHSPSVIEARKMILELLVANHPLDCMTCEKLGDCRLADYCYEYGIKQSSFTGEKHNFEIDENNSFIVRDNNKCILCGKCIRACSEWTGIDNLDFAYRGFNTKATPFWDSKLIESDCVFCGNCVAVCPTGALTEKQLVGKGRRWEFKKVRTTCPFCGTGCNFDLNVKDGKVIGVTSNADSPINGRALCVKGRFGWDFVHSDKRLTTPLIKKDGKFVEASWDEALDLVAAKFKELKDKYGPDSFAALSSARCTNEENFLVQKFTRAVMGTNNVDHCARTCHAPTVAGLAISLGSGAMTNSINDTQDAELIFAIGCNAPEAHPIVGYKMKEAKRKGAKLVTVDPRRTDLAEIADYWLRIKSGTDIPLLNGLMHIILEEGLQDQKFIDERTENFEAFKETIKSYTPEYVSKLTGVSVEDLYAVARLYATTDKAMIFWTLGITEHICGTHNVMSCANLAMLTGHYGRRSVGVNPLRGQNNVQGACDMGALPNVYSGYQAVTNKDAREKHEKAWGAPMPTSKGLMIPEMFDAANSGDIKFMYILGENPVLSDPNSNHIRKGLEKLEFLVIHELFLTETAEYADVILPAASFVECDGTFTGTERRVQRVREAIKPLCGKANWQTICDMSAKLGYPMNYGHPGEIWDEMASLSPSMAGINYQRMEELNGVVWPCPTCEHPGTPVMHIDCFTRGKGLFQAIDHIPPGELPDEEYPFLLNTGRTLQHYNVTTAYSKGLMEMWPEELSEFNSEDAAKLGVETGDKIKVTSRRGEVITRIQVTDRVPPGMLWMSLHFRETPTNAVTSATTDLIAKTGEYKVCAVRIEKA